MNNKRTISSVMCQVTFFVICSIAIMLNPSISHAYTFTFDGDGNSWKLGWTDGIGNRLGQPLFEGLLNVDESVTRSTNSQTVQDHYAEQIKPLQTAAADFFFVGTSLVDVIADPTMIPILSDEDTTGGLVSVYAVVDVTEWISEGGVYVPDNIYSGFNSDGTHSLLPGFTVGYSGSPIDFEDAFTINTIAGLVQFDQASPFNGSMGSLITTTKMTAAVPEPCTMLLLGTGLAGFVRYKKKSKK